VLLFVFVKIPGLHYYVMAEIAHVTEFEGAWGERVDGGVFDHFYLPVHTVHSTPPFPLLSGDIPGLKELEDGSG